jgi:hypothetical protein
MSPIGTSRHFGAAQQFGRFGSGADIQRTALIEPDELVRALDHVAPVHRSLPRRGARR